MTELVTGLSVTGLSLCVVLVSGSGLGLIWLLSKAPCPKAATPLSAGVSSGPHSAGLLGLYPAALRTVGAT